MAKMIEGVEALNRKLGAIKDKVPEAIRPVLLKSGHEVADDMRALAEASRRTAGPFEVLVTAGNTDARHAHLVESGTAERQHKDGTSTGSMPAAPFFNPAWRLNRKRVNTRISRALRKAFREAAND